MQEKRNPVLPIEKFPFLVLARNTIMLQHLIIHCLLHYLSSGRLWEVTNKGKFQTFSSISGRCRLWEVFALIQEVPNIVIWLGNVWYFGKLVAEGRWSLTRGDCNRRFNCIPEYFYFLNYKNSKIHILISLFIDCINYIVISHCKYE